MTEEEKIARLLDAIDRAIGAANEVGYSKIARSLSEVAIEAATASLHRRGPK